MIVLRSLVDAARGMPLTVDSKMAQEMHQIVVENGKLRDRLTKVTLDKDSWRFWAVVGLVYGSLMLGAAIHYRVL